MSKTIAYDYCFNCADIPYNDEIIDGTSVMISFVAYNDNLLKLQDSYIGVKDGEMSLSKQIGVISGTDSSLSNQHKDIEKFLKEDIEFKLKQTMTYSSDAYRLIETERQLREQREKLLNCDESKLSQAIDDISAFKNLWVEKNYRIQQLSEQVIQLQEERQSLERTINEKNNEINKLKEQIEKYRYSRDDKQTLYR